MGRNCNVVSAFFYSCFISVAIAGGTARADMMGTDAMMKALPKPRSLTPAQTAQACTPSQWKFESDQASRTFNPNNTYSFWLNTWAGYWFKNRSYHIDPTQRINCADKDFTARKLQEAMGDPPTGVLTMKQVNRFVGSVDGVLNSPANLAAREAKRKRSDERKALEQECLKENDRIMHALETLPEKGRQAAMSAMQAGEWQAAARMPYEEQAVKDNLRQQRKALQEKCGNMYLPSESSTAKVDRANAERQRQQEINKYLMRGMNR